MDLEKLTMNKRSNSNKGHDNIRASPIVSGLQVSRAHRFGDVTSRAEVDDLDPVGLAGWVYKHDVLRFQVSVDQSDALELHEGSGHLLQDGSDVLEWQWAELVLLEEVVQVLLQHLEDQARVVLVLEALVCSNKVVVVRALRAQPRQYAHLDLALPRIRRVVLEDLDGNNLAGATFPALHHLPKRPSTQELQHLVGVGHGAKHLVLQELVVTLAVGAAVFGRRRGGGGRSCDGGPTLRIVLDHGCGQLLLLDHVHAASTAVVVVQLLAFPLKPASLVRVQQTDGAAARQVVASAAASTAPGAAQQLTTCPRRAASRGHYDVPRAGRE